MKTMMNFTAFSDDLERFSDPEDLRGFYQRYGCAGLELTPYGDFPTAVLEPDMIVGIHVLCVSDWMDLPREELVSRYRGDLELARRVQAEYVVFHAIQVNDEEGFTYQMQHTDEEVIRAVADLVNAMLDGQDYSFHFLMENLWWPGLNLLDPKMTELLLDLVHYEKKGIMLDTGHFLHTNTKLRSQSEALVYLHGMLDRHEKLLPWIRGIHLQQSLTGAYVEEWLSKPHVLPEDPAERMRQVYEHIFRIDRHKPFTDPKVRELVKRVNPDYVTYEYISCNREEYEGYLKAGSEALIL